jgi:serralysin
MAVTILGTLAAVSPATASKATVDDQILHYTAGPGEVNHLKAAFVLTPIDNDLTGKVTLTDSVPITAGKGCVHPPGGDTKTVECAPLYLGEELPVFDLGDKNDVFTSTGSNPYVLDGPGNDTINAKASAVWVNGPGNDVFHGGPGADQVRKPTHGFGADTIFTGAGDDSVYAGPGDDQVDGGAGDDFLSGDKGSDRIHGGAGRDEISGGPGLDTMFGDAGVDRIDGRRRDFFRG